MKPSIGVLGSGIVAQTLAKGFQAKGYPVKIGSRDPIKLSGFSGSTGVATGTFAEVANFGEIVVLAVKGTAAEEALALAGNQNLSGKVVIDTTNPIADAPPVDGVLQFFTGPNDSLMERLQKAVPGARFVKAWNTLGNAFMVDPKLSSQPLTMFYCGDDESAKATVADILRDFGFSPEDMGKSTSARALEPLCQLWCIPGILGKGWAHAFQMVRPA